MNTQSNILQRFLIGGSERQALLSSETMTCRQQTTFELSASSRCTDMNAFPRKASHSHIWCLPRGQFEAGSIMVPGSICLNSGRS
jgi:hypothetical protein